MRLLVKRYVAKSKVASLHKLCISDDDILQGYLKTNEERREANELILEEYKQKGMSE